MSIAFAVTGMVGMIIHKEVDQVDQGARGGMSIPTFMVVISPIVFVPYIVCNWGVWVSEEKNKTLLVSFAVQWLVGFMVPQAVWFITQADQVDVDVLLDEIERMVFNGLIGEI